MILTSHPAPSWDSLTCNLSTGEGGKAQCHHDVSRVVGEGSFQQWWIVTEYIYSSTVLLHTTRNFNVAMKQSQFYTDASL